MQKKTCQNIEDEVNFDDFCMMSFKKMTSSQKRSVNSPFKDINNSVNINTTKVFEQ